MKGIILAGGSGTRLYPLTQVISKQLMPVYDKPMIYYPLSTLLSAGIQDILIITTSSDQELFMDLLGDGSQLGCSFSYAVQANPNGIAEAFLIAADFIAGEKVALILGDNIFYGQNFQVKLLEAAKIDRGAIIFGYWVSDPEKYGVAEINDELKVINLEEKPENVKSNYAIPGLYFYDNRVIDIAKSIKPSSRGEIEITDINKEYLKAQELRIILLGRGFAWLDTGTHESLLEASTFVEMIEKRQGLKIACIEEVAYRMGYIKREQVEALAEPLSGNGYGKYLVNMLNYEVKGVRKY